MAPLRQSAPTGWLLAPCGFWKAGSQQTTDHRGHQGCSLSLGLMVIDSISTHFHVGLCHKFTCFQTGILTAGNAVGELGGGEMGWEVPPDSRPKHLRAPPAPSPQSWASLPPLQAALLPADSPREGGLRICNREQPPGAEESRRIKEEWRLQASGDSTSAKGHPAASPHPQTGPKNGCSAGWGGPLRGRPCLWNPELGTLGKQNKQNRCELKMYVSLVFGLVRNS